jgi:hypothetical protein
LVYYAQFIQSIPDGAETFSNPNPQNKRKHITYTAITLTDGLQMEQVEWQNLDSTDIEDRATFKVVLLGAQVQAEEALYTFKHNVYPEQGVYWGTSKSAESYGWWTFHYLSGALLIAAT